MRKFKAIKTVYSYYMPEVRKIVSGLARNYPHNVFLRSVKPGLDDFHVPIIEKYKVFQSENIRGLDGFKFSYPTAGSEEGIREIMTVLQNQGVKSIYMLRGDYEGYKDVAKTRGMNTIEVDLGSFGKDPSSFRPGYWFISNPSAVDGNIIPNHVIEYICNAGHQVIYDLSYVGSTHPHSYLFNLQNPNILAALTSFSKPYGLFYYRVGFTFSRIEVPSLYGNKWFKNIFSLLIAKSIMEKLDPATIPAKYKRIQINNIIKEINEEHGLGIKPSHTFLLGNLPGEDSTRLKKKQLDMIQPFKRGNGYRFCLTPYFMEWEKRNK